MVYNNLLNYAVSQKFLLVNNTFHSYHVANVRTMTALHMAIVCME